MAPMMIDILELIQIKKEIFYFFDTPRYDFTKKINNNIILIYSKKTISFKI